MWSDNSAFVIRHMPADWLPTPDWLLFLVVLVIILFTITTFYLPVKRPIEFPHLYFSGFLASKRHTLADYTFSMNITEANYQYVLSQGAKAKNWGAQGGIGLG